MQKPYIAVFDSGIGGMSVLSQLIKTMPKESFIYFGDNDNAPYGSKTQRELLELMVSNVASVISFGVKVVVIACNTVSTTIFHQLSYYFPNVKFFGIFPPVEINLLHKRKTLLLCTPNTAKNYKASKYLTVLPLKDLAGEIERKMYDLQLVEVEKNLKEAVALYCKNSIDHNDRAKCLNLPTQNMKMIVDHRLSHFDVVILGCTHYFFVKEKIYDHFRPQVILGGENFTARKVKVFLESSKSLAKTKQNQIIFYGNNAFLNASFFEKTFPNLKNIKKILKK